MKYMMFVATDTEPDVDPTPVPEINDWFEQVTESWVAGDRLRPAAEATTVRVRSGELVLTDGPFAEAKECIAGFDILDCPDLEAAIAVAAKHPMARLGRIELRAFWPIDSSSE